MTLDLTNFRFAHIVIVWPNKAWAVFDVPPSWFALVTMSAIYRV